MRLKRPYVASLDQVRITREGDSAVIEYAEPSVWTTHLKVGPELDKMSDQDILNMFNEGIVATEELAAEYEHVAVEVPPGKPQIEFSKHSHHWVPRGGVLRCRISDGGPDNEPVIDIDNNELSWTEFGRLLTTYAGWGMRVVFVPEDETHVEPKVEIREPDNDGR